MFVASLGSEQLARITAEPHTSVSAGLEVMLKLSDHTSLYLSPAEAAEVVSALTSAMGDRERLAAVGGA